MTKKRKKIFRCAYPIEFLALIGREKRELFRLKFVFFRLNDMRLMNCRKSKFRITSKWEWLTKETHRRREKKKLDPADGSILTTRFASHTVFIIRLQRVNWKLTLAKINHFITDCCWSIVASSTVKRCSVQRASVRFSADECPMNWSVVATFF